MKGIINKFMNVIKNIFLSLSFLKTIIILFTCILLFGSFLYLEHSLLHAKEKNEKTYNLTIEGMTCTSCESAIKKSVKKLNGVKDVDADHKTGKGTIKFDEKQVKINDIIKSIENLGYKVIKYEESQ